MKTMRRLTTAALFFTATAFAPTIQAQAPAGAPTAADPVLKAIPDDALGFMLIKNLGQTDKAIAKLAATLQVPVPSVLSLFKFQAGIQEGLDENGSVAMALMPIDAPAILSENARQPTVPVLPVLFFPVSDYQKFIAQFHPEDAAAETTGVTIAGHALIAGHKDSFAVFTVREQKERLIKVISSTKGVDSLVGSFEPWIGRHQISIVATPAGSKKAFQRAAAGLKQIQPILAKLQNAQQSAQFNMALDIYETILSKAADEVDAFGVGLRLDDNSNLSIDSHTKFVAGGSWAAATKDLKPSKAKRFAGLGAMPLVFAGEGIIPAEWADGLAEFSASYMNQMNTASGGAVLDEQQRKDYAEAMRAIMKGLQSASFAMAPPKPGGSMYDASAGIMKVDDAKGYLTRYQKSLEQMAEITKGQKNPLFRFSDVKTIEIEGQSGLAITMDMSGMIAANNNPAAAKLMPLLWGPSGKLTIRVLPVDDHTLLFAYGSEDHAKEALAACKNPQSSLASDPDVATTLKLLPQHAQWIGLVSVKGYLDMISRIVSGEAHFGERLKLPEFPSTAPIGFAAEVGPHGLNTKLVVPAETMVSLSKFFQHTLRPLPPRAN